MNKKEKNITGNVRVHYTSPRVKVVELHARNRILSDSLDSSVQSKDWERGSESVGGFGDDEDE